MSGYAPDSEYVQVRKQSDGPPEGGLYKWEPFQVDEEERTDMRGRSTETVVWVWWRRRKQGAET